VSNVLAARPNRVRVELRDLTCAYVGGRYWDRTSGLCRVKAALSR
jgi:hypothetical protein